MSVQMVGSTELRTITCRHSTVINRLKIKRKKFEKIPSIIPKGMHINRFYLLRTYRLTRIYTKIK